MKRHKVIVACAATLSIAALFVAWLKSGPLTESLDELHGRTATQLIEDFGVPDFEDEYKIGDAVGEMRRPLLNHYPVSNPENKNVPIRELWWKDGDYTISVWFHRVNKKWVALDSLKWHKSIQF